MTPLDAALFCLNLVLLIGALALSAQSTEEAPSQYEVPTYYVPDALLDSTQVLDLETGF